MTNDIDIGFKEEPKDLEGFLNKEGYTLDNEQTEEDCIFYYNKKDDWPRLFYFPHTIEVEEEGEVPDWENSGFKVGSELNINYHFGDNPVSKAGRLIRKIAKILNVNYHFRETSPAFEAERLTKEIARKFDVVVYDPNNDEYFPGEELLG